MIHLSNFYFYTSLLLITIITIIFYFISFCEKEVSTKTSCFLKRPARKEKKSETNESKYEFHEIMFAAAWRFDHFCLLARTPVLLFYIFLTSCFCSAYLLFVHLSELIFIYQIPSDFHTFINMLSLYTYYPCFSSFSSNFKKQHKISIQNTQKNIFTNLHTIQLLIFLLPSIFSSSPYLSYKYYSHFSLMPGRSFISSFSSQLSQFYFFIAYE